MGILSLNGIPQVYHHHQKKPWAKVALEFILVGKAFVSTLGQQTTIPSSAPSSWGFILDLVKEQELNNIKNCQLTKQHSEQLRVYQPCGRDTYRKKNPKGHTHFGLKSRYRYKYLENKTDTDVLHFFYIPTLVCI